jgi:hypothetical protein
VEVIEASWLGLVQAVGSLYKLLGPEKAGRDCYIYYKLEEVVEAGWGWYRLVRAGAGWLGCQRLVRAGGFGIDWFKLAGTRMGYLVR